MEWEAKADLCIMGAEHVKGVADKRSEQAVRSEFLTPGSQTGDAKHNHENKGTDDLDLVFSRPSGFGIES